jgi:hypothetical protein
VGAPFALLATGTPISTPLGHSTTAVWTVPLLLKVNVQLGIWMVSPPSVMV